jgi:erythromycin esterase-like protein
LIAEKRFFSRRCRSRFPDAYRVNRFVRGLGEDKRQTMRSELLRAFRSGCGVIVWFWNLWMVKIAQRPLETSKKIGFYGLDLYSLHSSMAAVLDISKRLTRKRLKPPVIVIRVSTISAKTRKVTATRQIRRSFFL